MLYNEFVTIAEKLGVRGLPYDIFEECERAWMNSTEPSKKKFIRSWLKQQECLAVTLNDGFQNITYLFAGLKDCARYFEAQYGLVRPANISLKTICEAILHSFAMQGFPMQSDIKMLSILDVVKLKQGISLVYDYVKPKGEL